MPVNPDSLAELRRGLASLASRDAQRRYIQQIIDEAKVELTPVAAWLLVRLEQQPGIDPATLGTAHAVDASHIAGAISHLSARGFVESNGDGDSGVPWYGVTPAGCEVLGHLIHVRRAHLATAAAEFGATDDNAMSLPGIQRELVPDARPSTGEHPA